MNALGTHLILELKACDPQLLNDLPYVRASMIQAVEAVGVTVVGESFHQFSPYGITGVLAIAESHVCIHTWPEYGYAAVDIFTCGHEWVPRKVADLLIHRLRSQDPSLIELKRGVLPQLVKTTSD